MAGHSHAANIRHRKAAVDKKRSKIFSKIARRIIVESRLGGPDPETNASLRLIVETARAANMPKDVIQRNIDKGAGVGADAVAYEDVVYEGYAQGGVAVMVEGLTDNRNRTSPEIKKLFERAGGNLGQPGCVGYLFESKAIFLVKGEGKSEDEVMETVLELGAEDMEAVDDGYMITAEPSEFVSIKAGLEERGFELELAEVQKLAQNTIEITDEAQARKVLKLIEALEDHEDVQNVSTNHSLSEELAAKLEA